ncbi:MAG: RluA family pseudouridine synthase [Clostridia bacterium]|jgi:23S rRNA pseudouridine1911/1915/1917 synthase|nr:RluA family pseudouridine synthase [Clostridia bacterium]
MILQAKKDIKNMRLDMFILGAYSSLTRSHIKIMVDKGAIKLNGKIAYKAGELVSAGDIIEFELEVKETDIKPEKLELEIVYQDEDLAVINKAQGVIVHPSGTVRSGTLVNALLFYIKDLSGINGEYRPGIVHRLDKDTSGLLVIAKNDYSHNVLSSQLANKTCHRIYRAVLEGALKDDSGTIDTNIARSKSNRKNMAVCDLGEGRRAITTYTVLERFNNYTYVEFKLYTGRTHQIRVHCKHIGHSIVGDKTYGFTKQKFKLEGQLLHAYKLGFIHPRTNEYVEFECELPPYFKEVLEKLRNTNM